MVDRIEFSPLGGVDPRQLFAQREARQALLNSLVTEAPRVSAPGPRPAPDLPSPAETSAKAGAPQRQERPEQEEARRTAREKAARQDADPPETGAALGLNQSAGEPAGPADAALERRLGPEAQLPLPGSGLSGAPLFGGFGPVGPSNPLVSDLNPIGETRGEDESLPGPPPLGGAQPGEAPAAPETRAPEPPVNGPGEPGDTPIETAEAQNGNEPRGSVVDVLV